MTNIKRNTTEDVNMQPEKGVVIHNITIRPVQRSTQDITSWRSALQTAEGIIQSRIQLYDLFADLLLDGVLSSVMEKRILNVTKAKLIFTDHAGKENEAVTDLLQTSHFRELRKEILLQKFWGISVIELIKDDKGFRIFSIDRKHIKPKEGKILFEQMGEDGIHYRNPPFDKYVLEVGKWNDMGLLVKAAPYVIYKRGGFGNWADFAQVFGMPFREARYDGFNQTVKMQLEQALESMGSRAYGIFPKEAEITLHEAGNVSANGDLYDQLRNACNQELSVLILGQTGTTMQTPGKLGNDDTHEATEDDINTDDRAEELSVLNEKVKPILANLGYPVKDGKFVYEVLPEKMKLTEKAQMIVNLKNNAQLPVDDEYLYETFGIPKPANYNEIKAQQEADKVNAQQEEDSPPTAKKPGKTANKKEADKKLSGWDAFREKMADFFDPAHED